MALPRCVPNRLRTRDGIGERLHECLRKRLDVLYRKVEGMRVAKHGTIARDVRCDDDAAERGRLEQRVRETLRLTGNDEDIRGFKVRDDIRHPTRQLDRSPKDR